MKVSFDFDGTLEYEEVQEYAKELIERGVDVWVVTTRWDENHKHRYSHNATLDDLWEVVDKLKIPRWKVRFTCMEWKYTYFNGTSILWHLDDNEDERDFAKRYHCNVPIIIFNHNWKENCEKILNEANNLSHK